MKCSLHYMDFEGRSDGRSIKSILSHVAPLKLVWCFLITAVALCINKFVTFVTIDCRKKAQCS